MLLRQATNTSAFLKMGIMGKQGAGKTKTAGKVAIGLVNYLKAKGVPYADKPVAFFDTETGSDYLIPDFEAAGIPFLQAKTKTLKDLIEVMKEAEANCSALIIDSITHPYRELIAAYLKQKNRTFLQIDDWNYIKGDYGWAQFTKLYINSKLHIIMCGRAGDDLEQYVDENGKRQLEKIGTKMKTEAETGFEPSLLVLMELIERNERGQGVLRERVFVNRATVMKDRWDKINGDQFDDPDFKDFLPHISLLALGGEHVGVRDTGDSRSILLTEKRDWQPMKRKFVIDEIEALLTIHDLTGQSGDAKKKRVEIVHRCFGTFSRTEIEDVMPLADLQAGYDKLHRELEGKPSKYTAPDPEKVELNDSLPDHSAPVAETNGGGGKSIEELLLAQLLTMETPIDVAHFGMEVSRRTDLDTRTRLTLANASTAQLAKVSKPKEQAAETAEAKPDGGKKRKPAAAKAEPVAETAEQEPAAMHAAQGCSIPAYFG